jgi:hypothetical protein
MQQQLEQAVYQQPAPVPAAPQPAVAAPAQGGPVPVVARAPRGHSPLHLDLGGDAPNVFKSVPEGTICEGEIVKAEETRAQTSGNPMIKLQLKACWPLEYAGATFYDNVVLIAETAWKYKSLCAACVDEAGERLLSPDNRFFTGQGVEDFLGNVVRFKADEPTVSAAGNPVNRVKGGYNPAYETDFGDGPDAEAVPAMAAAGPSPQVQW